MGVAGWLGRSASVTGRAERGPSTSTWSTGPRATVVDLEGFTTTSPVAARRQPKAVSPRWLAAATMAANGRARRRVERRGVQGHEAAVGVEELVEDQVELEALGELGDHEAGELVAHDEVLDPGGLGDGHVGLVQHLGHHPGPAGALGNALSRVSRVSIVRASASPTERLPVAQHDRLVVGAAGHGDELLGATPSGCTVMAQWSHVGSSGSRRGHVEQLGIDHEVDREPSVRNSSSSRARRGPRSDQPIISTFCDGPRTAPCSRR